VRSWPKRRAKQSTVDVSQLSLNFSLLGRGSDVPGFVAAHIYLHGRVQQSTSFLIRNQHPTEGFALLQTLGEKYFSLSGSHFPQLLQAPLLHLHLLLEGVAFHLQGTSECLEPNVFTAKSAAFLDETLTHLPRATVEVLNQAPRRGCPIILCCQVV
jgi:hypothetical protein